MSDVNRKASSLWSFVASLKKISSTSDLHSQCQWTEWTFYSFIPPTLHTSFHYLKLINVHSRRSWADNPQGTKFWGQQKPLVTSVICYKFKKYIFEVWFYTHSFLDFIHVYSPGVGADNPLGTKFWCQQEHLVTLVICYKLQKISFKSDFI